MSYGWSGLGEAHAHTGFVKSAPSARAFDPAPRRSARAGVADHREGRVPVQKPTCLPTARARPGCGSGGAVALEALAHRHGVAHERGLAVGRRPGGTWFKRGLRALVTMERPQSYGALDECAHCAAIVA
jgi:hypothetical protein